MLSLSPSGGRGAFNGGNGLTLITDPSSNLATNTQDNSRNLTVTNDNGTVTTYAWTHDNRLRTVALSGGAVPRGGASHGGG